jgi:hypothetical protein
MTRPSWFGRAVRNRHRHAIEQASRTRRKILISAQRVTSRIAVIAICQCQVQSEMMTAPSAANASMVHGFRLFSSVAGV